MASESARFPPDLRAFVDGETWTLAKTMPEWPHEYLVRDRVDEGLFVQLVQHIREQGSLGRIYRRELIYFEEDGLVYWTMGAPVEETVIINRCSNEETYEARLEAGRLP